MKPLSYYETPLVSYPDKKNYLTKFYYKKGKLILTKKGFCDEDFTPPEGCIQEESLDDISYQCHLTLYREEVIRLQEEFKEDLLEKYQMTNHPRVEQYFHVSWEFGSGQLSEVEYYFKKLIKLSKSNPEDDLSNIMFNFK